MEYQFKCPKCGSTHLRVISCLVTRGCGSMDFEYGPDGGFQGFMITGNTQDEIIECAKCEFTGDFGAFENSAW